MQTLQTKKTLLHRRIVILIIILVLVFVMSIFIGRYPQPYWMSPSLLFEDDLANKLVSSLRLPRIIMAMLLGMTLSVCGAVLQMIFRNPIVEPGFLGVTQGAGFGAAFSILFLGNSRIMIESTATFFALLGLSFSFLLARHLRFGGWILRLILSGIVVSAIFSSGLGIMKYLADPLTQLQEITFWLLGGLWSVKWQDVLSVLPITIPGLIIVFLMRWRLNILSLSDETAFSLGASASWERGLILVSIVAAAAVITSVSGIIQWVGLIIPQLSRRIFGPNAQYNIPGAMLLGGIFSIICDDIARTLLAGEIPLGILTSLFGGLVFIILMTTSRIVLDK